MSYDPRSIAFLAEVLFPPCQLPAEMVQRVHNTLYQQPEISYQNFQVAADGIHLSNVSNKPGGVSSVSFGPDRLIIREELQGRTVEEFATRVVNVASISFKILKIPMSMAQQFIVRSLITPRSVSNSQEFLAQRLVSQNPDAWQRLGRPVQGMGLRYTFPQNDEQKNVFNVRVETWNQDPRSLWLENIGSFTQPTPMENLSTLSQHLHQTYAFLTGQVCEFLREFDRS